MAIGCGATFAKIVLIIYNIIFLLTGLFLIGLGIWLIADGYVQNLVHLTFNGSNSDLFRNAAILLIAMGALVVIISVVGFVGAIIENPIMLGIYIGFLVVIFCGEIAGGVLAIVYKDQIVYNLDNILASELAKQISYGTTTPYYSQAANGTRCQTSDVGYLFDFVQIELQCCGISSGNGNSGYEGMNYTFLQMCPNLNPTFANFPISCFPLNSTATFGQFHTNPDNEYNSQKLVKPNTGRFQTGCSDALAIKLEQYAPVLIGIGIGFGMLELFGIIFAVCLCRNVGEDD